MGKGDIPPPFQLNIGLTQRCNLNCIMCEKGLEYNKDVDEPLKREDLLDLVEEASRMGIKTVHIGGSGEPFFRKELAIEIMKRVKENGMKGHIVTNMTLLEEDDIKDIVRMAWDKLQVSLDASKAETHDNIRGVGGTFGKIVENLKRLKTTKDKMNETKPKLVISPVLTNRNYEQLNELIEMIQHIGLENYNFFLQPLQKRNKKAEALKLSRKEGKEFTEILENLKNATKDEDIDTNLHSIDRKVVDGSFQMGDVAMESIENDENSPGVHCYAPWLGINIGIKGNAEPCYQMETHEENIKNSSLSKIWKGKFFNRIRTKVKNNELMLPCKNCCGANVLETKEINRNGADN